MEKLPFKIGDEIKNYKVMCELLGEKVRTSNSKKSQLKRWEQYFKWEHKGHMFIITEIINNQYPTHDNNLVGQGVKKHSKELQSLLLHFLKAHNTKYDSHWITISMKGLIELAQIFTNEFHLLPYNSDILQENQERFGVQKNFINDFYTRVYTTSSNDIQTALKQLEQRGIIAVEELYMGRPNECIRNGIPTKHLTVLQNKLEELKLENMFIEYLNHYGIISDSKHEQHNKLSVNEKQIHFLRPLEPFETNVFLGIRKQLLQEKGFQNLNDVYRKNQVKSFYNSLNQELKRIMHMKYIFKGYRIIFLPHVIEQQEIYKSFKLNPIALEKIKKEFDTGFQNNITNNYNIRKQKTQSKNIQLSCYDFEAQTELCPLQPIGASSVDKLLLGVDDLESVVIEMLEHFMKN